MLEKVRDAFVDEVEGIRAAFLEVKSSRIVEIPLMAYAPATDGCVVSLWDAWNRCLRSLYLGCAAGPVDGLNGKRYLPNTEWEEADAVAELARLGANRGNRIQSMSGEPKWYQVDSAPDICDALGLSNREQIVGGLSASTITTPGGFELDNPVQLIQTARNYIAHKSERNRMKLENLVPAGVKLEEVLVAPTQGGASSFEGWCDALIGLAEASLS